MPLFQHPVCDIPVTMPNGQAWMIQDGYIEVDVDLWATDGPVPYTVEAGGVEAYHARLDLIDSDDREVTIELDAGHPVVKHLLTTRREAIIDEAIDHAHD
jgi:hypothetical protein